MKLYKFLIWILLAVTLQAQVPLAVSQTTLKAELDASNLTSFILGSSASGILNLTHQYGYNPSFIYSVSATTGITLQAETDAIADSNKFYTSVGDWTLHGSGSITRNADSSLTYSNIPQELNPNPNFDDWNYVELLRETEFNTACGVDWSCNTNYTIASGKASINSVSATNLNTNYPLSVSNGHYYLGKYTISDYVSGNPKIGIGYGANGIASDIHTGNGDFYGILEPFDSSPTTLFLTSGSNINFSVERISLAELVPPTGWTASTMNATNYVIQDDNGLRLVSDGTITSITTSTAFMSVGKRYAYKIVINSSSGAGVAVGTSASQPFVYASAGTYYDTLTATGVTGAYIKRNGGATNTVISELSITEVHDENYIALPYQPTQNQVHEFSFNYLKDSNDVKVLYTINNQIDSTETVTTSYQTATKKFVGGNDEDDFYSFDGVNDYIDFANTGSNIDSAQISFSLDSDIIGKPTSAGQTLLNFGTTYFGIRLGACTGNYDNEIITVYTSGTGGASLWRSDVGVIAKGKHTISIKWNGTYYLIYLDGIRVDNQIMGANIMLNGTSPRLGRLKTPYDLYLTGDIFLVKLYGSGEVLLLDLNGDSTHVTDAVWYDASGNDNHGTVSGATPDYYPQLRISLSDTGKVKIKNPSIIKKNSWVVNRNDTLNIPYTLATNEVGSFNGTITAYTSTGNKTSNFNWDVEYSLADYYVSNNGSDSADGLSELTAWRTLEKVNEHDSAYGFSGGDKILLEANSTWKGKLKINSSGTEEAPILIDWYHKELNNKPTIINAEYISGYTIHSAGGSTVLDTVEQRLANISTTGTISGEYIVGRKVTFVDGTLNKYFMRTLQKTPVKTQMKLYTKTGATSFSVVPSSESVVKTSLADSVNTWELLNPLTVTAGDYWIALVAEQGVTGVKIPYQTGGADTNYFIHTDNNSWNTGLSSATFPSTITPNLSFQKLLDGSIGAEIETSSGSSGTIYKTVIADLEQLKLNSVAIAKRVSLANLDDENEYAYSNDTLYTFQDTTLNRIIKDGGVQLLGDNIIVKNLYVSYSDTAFALNGHNIILDSVYTVNNGFGFVNNDKAEITRSGFIGNMTSVSNDSLNLNTSIFINSGLWDSSAVLLDGGISDITHNSFRSSYAGESYLKDQNSIRTLVNNAFQNDHMDFTIKLQNIMPIASNNAYGGVFSFKAEGNTTSSAATWADWLGEPFYVATSTISFTSDYNLTPSSTSSLLVNNGLSTTISKDYYSNPFRYAGTLTDIGAIELQDTVSTETDPIPSGTNLFVTNSGSTNYSDGFNESVGITYETLKTNFSSVSNNTNILFKRGETFENVYLQVNTKSNLLFSSYGTGSKPRLRGKTALTSISNASKWTKITDSTWTYQLTSGTSEYPVTSLLYRVWLNGQEYQFAHYTNRGGLGSALVIDPLITEDMKISRNFRWEYDGSRAKLKVYVPAGQFPYNYYTSIEYVGKYPDILEFKYCDGIEVSNLQLEGGYFGSMMLEESLDFDVHDNIMYDGGQGLVRVRGDLADNNLIHDNLIDSRFNLIHFAPVRYEPENYHLVDIQWGADNNKVFDNIIKNGGISHFRIITIVGSGLSENNWFYNNTVTSELAYARPIHITTLSSSSADASTSTYVFNNYFGNMKTRMQVGGRDTRFFYNVFDTLKGLQDVKVLHHYGATSEAYEINDFDDFLHQFADASAKLGNFYFFNNTIYTAGREAIRFGLIFDGDDGNYYLNNLIINSCDASTYNLYYTDLYFPLYTYPRPNIVKNNFSWHKTRSNTAYANYYNETWYNWSSFNSAETGSDVFSGNIQKGVSDIANVNLIFQDLSNNDFRVKTGLGITNGGVDVSSYLPYTPFYDRNGIRVDNDTAPNIGALNNP